MSVTIPVYSSQELTPRAMEVLRAIVDDAFPDDDIHFSRRSGEKKVLVFGAAPTSNTMDVEFIYTYSIAQMMSKPNAATVIAAGIRQFITEPERPPFRQPVGYISVGIAVASLDPDKPTAIDIETSGNLGKEDTPEDIHVISVAFYQEGCEPIVIHNNQYDLTSSQLWILHDELPKFSKAIYHNGKFDTRVLNRELGLEKPLVIWFDTMLASHVLNIASGEHGLKPLARRYLAAWDWEAGLKEYTKGGGHYELIPINKLIEYNGWDVYFTYKLWELFAPQIEADEDNQKAFEIEMAASPFLLTVEKYGIPINEAYGEWYGARLDLEIESELRRVRSMVGDDKFNPGSWQQVKKFLEQWYKVVSTDEEHIKEILELAKGKGGGPRIVTFCEALLEYRKLKKIRGTYVTGWMNKTREGRVHPTFKIHGTTTGRLASSDPNAQNVPRDKTIRKIVRTRDAWV